MAGSSVLFSTPPRCGFAAKISRNGTFSTGMKKRISAPVEVLNALVWPVTTVNGFGASGSTNVVNLAGQGFTWKDFKTSTGLEIRFFMPVLNVPFRLIFAYNPQREGVRDNQLLLQKAFQFRFAVGSTF